MKVLAIVGTGRRNGSVSNICKKIIAGAKDNGNEGELINLFDYTVNYCVGCRFCSKDGRGQCVQKDDFESILDKIIKADVIILGSPVYWGNVSAIMKNFFDRHMSVEYMFPKGDKYQQLHFWDKLKSFITEMNKVKLRNGIENKRYIIVTALTGFKITDIFMGHVSLLTKAMKQYIYGMKGTVIKKFVYTDTLFKFIKNKEEKIMQNAFNFGKHLK
ncbi:flavodoxin family protein [Clostridium sp.]|uniref:flavodoxin family protein n=1 Tax=Clostridium sp. TaxID=1506 RepID=UPI00263971B8|nr:flavodoxin family protein [Clostridium sp.]